MRFSSVIHRLALVLLCCGVLACESMPFGRSSTQRATTFKLPSLVPPRDSVEVDIVFVDRPVSDPLLGKSLWREVDQVGTLTADQRAALREAGILVGHVGSSPPDALQALLKLTDEDRERQRREANGIPTTASRRVALPAGSDTEVWSNEAMAQKKVTLPEGKSLDLSNLRGLLRLRAERSLDGWARLDFTPELHHGQTGTRPFATATGWMYRTTQEVIPCFAQQFSATLNVGEMLVMTCDRDRSGTLGQSLFQFEDSTGSKQRLVVVRLADLREIIPKRMRTE
ncbi:MAG: hypothetical protein FJ302_16695 [Planctomycetes bacterium]|nr:hypothetical protein [Planctomycetota bacterium]